MGQLGTSPSTTMPDSHNAGDFGSFLVGAPHRYALDAQELQRHKTDGHLDIDAVRAGAILVCPVKLDGAGIYLGDMHALQGDGEIAGHTCDVSGAVTLQVEVLKDLGNDGPILFPLERICRSWLGRSAAPSASGPWRWRAGTAWKRSRSRCRSR